MNDNTRALIEMVLKTAGQAGSQGFAYLVAYARTDGAVGFLFSLVIVAFLGFLMALLMRWKPRDENMNDFVAPGAWRGLALVAVSIGIVCFICSVANNLTEFLQPQGAAILSALHHSV